MWLLFHAKESGDGELRVGGASSGTELTEPQPEPEPAPKLLALRAEKVHVLLVKKHEL